MTNVRYSFVLLASLSLAVFAGCKKDAKCTAGTGGNVTLVVYPQHHGMPIINHANYRDTVMVKFNTQEFPGANPSSYNLVLVGDSGEDHVHVQGVTCGDYYIYAVGLDTTLMKRVSGGIPFSTDQTREKLSWMSR